MLGVVYAYHVRGGEVVEQVWDTTSTGCCDCDIQDSFRTCIGFFKGEVADVSPNALFKYIYVEEVAFAKVADRSTHQGL